MLTILAKSDCDAGSATLAKRPVPGITLEALNEIAPPTVVRHFGAMRRFERQNHSSSVLEPSYRAPSLSSIDAPSPARVTLPSDLSGSLKSLDDAQRHRQLGISRLTESAMGLSDFGDTRDYAAIATPVTLAQVAKA